MNGARSRLATKDYKHGSRRGEPLDLREYKQFGLGLAIGLAIAFYVWMQAQRNAPEAVAAAADGPAASEVVSVEEADPAEQYDFYDMLPKFEVVVPEAERNPRRDQPTVQIAKAGAYVLQAGSYRNRADAERLRDRLKKLGIDATVQLVTIDDNEWHRVRIGPSRDLKFVNATREQLRAADISFIVYEVGE